MTAKKQQDPVWTLPLIFIAWIPTSSGKLHVYTKSSEKIALNGNKKWQSTNIGNYLHTLLAKRQYLKPTTPGYKQGHS